MTKTILLATDLTARSDRALHRSISLARQTGAKLTLLTVVDDELPSEMAQDQVDHAQRQLEASRAALCPDLTCDVLVERGDPAERVLSHAREDSPDLLVIGPHRERTLWDQLHETTGQRIARLTHVAVLLVVRPAETPYDTVLVATDFSPAASTAVALAHAVAPQATLRAFHALHVPYGSIGRAGGSSDNSIEASFRAEVQASDEKWRLGFSAPDTLQETEIVTGSAEALFHKTVQSDHIPLIAIGAHGRVGAHRALLGSLATSLMRRPPCDVLVCRPR